MPPGVIPSWFATCSADGVPNATILSIVHYVDSERVALTRQFFNKTRANLDANPQAQVIVVDPGSGDQFALDLRYLHTRPRGRSSTRSRRTSRRSPPRPGMSGRLPAARRRHPPRPALRPFGDSARSVEEERSRPSATCSPLLDEFVRRLALCTEYAEAARVGLEALDDLFGFAYSILLTADERGDRLFAVASNGYTPSGVGAEVPVGVGLVGIAAERRRVVCVPSLARSRAMNAAIQESIRRAAPSSGAAEIELPGLERVRSAAAVPLLARGEFTGVLYLESEQEGEFGPGDDRLLRILGGQLAAALAMLRSGSRRERADESAPAAIPRGSPLAVAYYQADDSVFVDDATWSRACPGGSSGSCCASTPPTARTNFTNRELRLDESLGLPAGNDNLEARLLVLRKRLAAISAGSGSNGSPAAASRSVSRCR